MVTPAPVPLYDARRLLGTISQLSGRTKVNVFGQPGQRVRDIGEGKQVFWHLGQQIRAKMVFEDQGNGILNVVSLQRVPFSPQVVFGENLVAQMTTAPIGDTITADGSEHVQQWASQSSNAPEGQFWPCYKQNTQGHKPVLEHGVMGTGIDSVKFQNDHYMHLDSHLSPEFSMWHVIRFADVSVDGKVYTTSRGDGTGSTPDVSMRLDTQFLYLHTADGGDVGRVAVLANKNIYVEIIRSQARVAYRVNDVEVATSIHGYQKGDYQRQNLNGSIPGDGVAVSYGEWTYVNRAVSEEERAGYLANLLYRIPPTIS